MQVLWQVEHGDTTFQYCVKCTDTTLQSYAEVRNYKKNATILFFFVNASLWWMERTDTTPEIWAEVWIHK